MSGDWNRICTLIEMLPERGAACLVDGYQIALFRIEGDTVLAVGNFDPFARANVISRGIVGTQEGRWFVASPMYKHRFDLRTGTCHDCAEVCLPVFPVRVDSGVVYVAVPEE
ncbi:MAG: nitrite reductase small subunit NirD [Actinomycetota bacterium]|nr:nitrite reductase small subunit NirD [Actinomycetota bacterium]